MRKAQQPEYPENPENNILDPKMEQEILSFSKVIDRVRKPKNAKDAEEAFNIILKALDQRIKSLCFKFRIHGLDHSDIYQEALYALRYKAIKDYDRLRGATGGWAPFDRFALLCIRRHLATELKSSHQIRKIPLNTAKSLDQDNNIGGDDDLSLINIVPRTEGDVGSQVADKEYMRKIYTALFEKMSPFEKQVFILFVKKCSYEEISEIINERKNTKINVDIKSVDNALSRIKEKAKSICQIIQEKEID